MAIYRSVQMSFWSDPTVVDEFTPEDKYFYLYLLTNPHTNLCGCYQISMKQMEQETGYNKDTLHLLIGKFEKIHKLVKYSEPTKEILILKWSKYNWTKSEKFLIPLFKEIESIKNVDFKAFLTNISGLDDTVCIPYGYGMDTTVTVTVTDTVTDTVKKKGVVGGNKYFDSEELNNAFSDYITMRKKIKAPMTDRAIDLAITKLKKLSAIPFSDDFSEETAIEILNNSIMNSWKGLFPLEKDKPKTQNDKIADRLEGLKKWL